MPAPTGRVGTPIAQRLPADHPLRRALHEEIHARPTESIPAPALVTQLVMLHEGTTAAAERSHLEALGVQVEPGLFTRFDVGATRVRWERHSEFSRYTFIEPIDARVLDAASPNLTSFKDLPGNWMSAMPGRTIAGMQLVVVEEPETPISEWVDRGLHWFGHPNVVGSVLGSQYARVMADYRLRKDGFIRFLVTGPRLPAARIGRVAARLIESEVYRMMALLGFPIARQLGATLARHEAELAELTRRIDDSQHDDQSLLGELNHLAANIESAIATQSFRFSATAAYAALMSSRINELRESPIHGLQSLGQFLDRRVTPAIATVGATERRLNGLAERISRAGSLLRTKVDIVHEQQNQSLLERLTTGQRMQVKLQQTVEGLSVAAISYYVVGLLGYAFKALQRVGAPINVDVAVGLSIIPTVLLMAYFIRRVKDRVIDKAFQGEARKAGMLSSSQPPSTGK
jgi:uncharacterized membrane-anchored protein